MTDPKSWSWFKNGRRPSLAEIAARKPPTAKNPSLIAGKNPTQNKPITLPKVWGKGG